MSSYEDKKARLLAQLAAVPAQDKTSIGLAKKTSNLFRDRIRAAPPKINLHQFNQVIRVDPATGTVEAEGMTTYVDLVEATLARGTMPEVVPQLKSITLGGAVAGVGIEASSFRYGLVHDTIVALEVLTGDHRILTCTPDNGHRDLFYGFANSYGTLGYALKVTARTAPVQRFVRLDHVRYTDADSCFAEVAKLCAEGGIDFLDGTVFAEDELYLTRGRFVDSAPYTSDYTFEQIYYRSIRERDSDYVSARDYIWRWDTDWLWCSKQVFAQNPLLRRLLGRRRLNSITYQRIMRWNSRWGVTRRWNRLRGAVSESVIQDVDIPIDRAAEFLVFLLREIGILPIWLCPIKAPDARSAFTLYPLRAGGAYINFGFWDVIIDREAHPRGYYNRKIEREVAELGGIKSLYSDSYFDRDEFWSIYNRPAYEALKRRYDPESTLGDLYEKCVLRT